MYSEKQELHACGREPRTGPRVMHGWAKTAFTDEPELGFGVIRKRSLQSQPSRIGRHSDYETSLSVALPLERHAANLSLQRLVAASFAPYQPPRAWTQILFVLKPSASYGSAMCTAKYGFYIGASVVVTAEP